MRAKIPVTLEYPGIAFDWGQPVSDKQELTYNIWIR